MHLSNFFTSNAERSIVNESYEGKPELRLRQQFWLLASAQALTIAVPGVEAKGMKYHGGILAARCLSGQRVCAALIFLVLFVASGTSRKPSGTKRTQKQAMKQLQPMIKEKKKSMKNGILSRKKINSKRYYLLDEIWLRLTFGFSCRRDDAIKLLIEKNAAS